MVFKTTKDPIIKFVNVSSKRKNTPNKVKPKVLEEKKKVKKYDKKYRLSMVDNKYFTFIFLLLLYYC